MDKPGFVERRKHPRVPLKVKVQCYKVEENNRRGVGILHFISKNISLGGIFLETRLPLEVGALIYLKFALPGLKKPVTTRARIIDTQGKVKRVTDGKVDSMSGMGIEFQFLGHDERKLIEQFVSGIF